MSIHVNELKLPEGATPVTPGTIVVAQVVSVGAAADAATPAAS
jgi:hypothetical protein